MTRGLFYTNPLITLWFESQFIPNLSSPLAIFATKCFDILLLSVFELNRDFDDFFKQKFDCFSLGMNEIFHNENDIFRHFYCITCAYHEILFLVSIEVDSFLSTQSMIYDFILRHIIAWIVLDFDHSFRCFVHQIAKWFATTKIIIIVMFGRE
jgi:hypothetical protein